MEWQFKLIPEASTTRRAHNGRWTIGAITLFSIFCACRHPKPEKSPQETYRDIAQYIESGEYDSALKASKEAAERFPESRWGWRFRLQYALTLLLTDQVKVAAGVLEPDLPPAFSALRPRYQYVKAYLRYRQHDPIAESLVKSAVAQAQAFGDPETEVEGSLMLLRFHDDTVPEVAAIAGHALAVAQRNNLPFQEANALSELGDAMLDHDRYADAIPYYLETASRAKKLKAHYLQVSSLANLAECYLGLGNLDQALRSLSEAQPQLRPGDPSALQIGVNSGLGRVYSLRKQNFEAIHYFQQAFKIAQPLIHGESYAECANNLAQAFIEEAAPDSVQVAERYNELARQALAAPDAAQWNLTAPTQLNRADIAAKRGQLHEAKALYGTVLRSLKAAPTSPTQWFAHAGLADVEVGLRNVPEARKNFELALSGIESNRSQQNEAKYRITFLSALIRFYQQYVDFLVKHKQPWDALAVADSSRAGVLTEGLNSSRHDPDFVAKIHREARASHSALVFYWLAPKQSYVWVVTPTNDGFELLPPEADIQRDVKRYSEIIQTERRDALEDSSPAGLSLYQTLIAPIAAHLRPGMRVVVVPDGALHGLNFETLLVKGDKPHYWIDDVSLVVAPSLRILLDKRKRQRTSKQALIIGDPRYTDSDFPPLPESKREVAQVSARFPESSTVLTQQEAVSEAYAKARPELFSLIHFSAHVEADPLSPLDSAIILSADQYGQRRLYARDFMKSHLNADLVTVSGCRSAGPKELSGEGMVGFAWAAFEAGARHAVTSLWAADDRSTTDLMDNFYAGVKAGKPYATALQDAKLQMLHQTAFRKPYYWGPFQLYSRNLQDRRR
jgi:CHAT domain-containing protein